MKNKFYTILFFYAITSTVNGQGLVDSLLLQFESHQYLDMPYRLLNPVNNSGRFPVIISLHGAGGRGGDNLKQLKDSKWLNYLAEEKNRSAYPCYLFVPQSNELWNEDHLSKFKEVIRHLPSVDTTRIYIMGHSMGGHGTYRLIQMDPIYFAAAVPSAGSGLPETEEFIDVLTIKNIPIWAFHGDMDKKCPYEKDMKVFEAMQKIGGNMKFTTWFGDGHGGNVALKMVTGSSNGRTSLSSNQCDAEPDFLKWLFNQSKTINSKSTEN